MKAEPGRKLPAALHVRLVTRDEVELWCLCGFERRQGVRDPIAERCPKCGRWWRR
jgi:hypothetical protein